MEENAEVTESNIVDDDLENICGCLYLANPMSQLNIEELRVV